jgi:hypothetical protein
MDGLIDGSMDDWRDGWIDGLRIDASMYTPSWDVLL